MFFALLVCPFLYKSTCIFHLLPESSEKGKQITVKDISHIGDRIVDIFRDIMSSPIRYVSVTLKFQKLRTLRGKKVVKTWKCLP